MAIFRIEHGTVYRVGVDLGQEPSKTVIDGTSLDKTTLNKEPVKIHIYDDSYEDDDDSYEDDVDYDDEIEQIF